MDSFTPWVPLVRLEGQTGGLAYELPRGDNDLVTMVSFSEIGPDLQNQPLYRYALV